MITEQTRVLYGSADKMFKHIIYESVENIYKKKKTERNIVKRVIAIIVRENNV